MNDVVESPSGHGEESAPAALHVVDEKHQSRSAKKLRAEYEPTVAPTVSHEHEPQRIS